MSNQPVAEYVAGKAKATVWQSEGVRDGRKFPQFSTRVRKEYYDDRSQSWKSTEYFGASELADLTLVIHEAYKFIRLRDRTDATPSASPDAADRQD